MIYVKMSVKLVVYKDTCQATLSFKTNDSSTTSVVPLINTSNTSSIIVMNNNKVIPFYYSPAMVPHVSSLVTVTKNSRNINDNNISVTGRILLLDSSKVILSSEIISPNNNIEGALGNITPQEAVVLITNYDTIVLNDVGDVPQQRVVIEGKYDDTIKVMYNCDIRWKATCIILNESYLKLIATVTNNTNEILDADLTIVNKTFYPDNSCESCCSSTFNNTNNNTTNTTNTNNTNNTTYINNVGHKIVHEMESFELGAYGIRIDKVYVHTIGDDRTYLGYIFNAPDNIPKCDVQFYDSNMISAGRSQITYDRVVGNEILLITDCTSSVKSSSVITKREETIHIDSDNTSETIIHKTIITNVKNNTDVKINYVLRIPIYDLNTTNVVLINHTTDANNLGYIDDNDQYLVFKLSLFESGTVTNTISYRRY